MALARPEDAAISGNASPRRAIVRSLVAVCPHVAHPAGAVELARLRSHLEPRFGVGDGTVDVEVVAELCDRPEALVDPVRRTGAHACILALCDGRAPLPEYRAWVARAGMDPFRVDVLPPGLVPVRGAGERDLERLAAQLAACATRLSIPAAVGRARRLLPFPARLSRRALFTVPARPIAPAASIIAGRCSAPRCSICLPVCPTGAIQADDHGRVSVVADRCDGCGVCVSACPADAFDLPGSSLGEHEVFLEELLRPSPGSVSDAPVGIVFACASDADRWGGTATPGVRFAENWSVVPVPCVSMVTPGWILQVIASGVPAVVLAPCRDPAPLPRGVSLLQRVEFCRDLLEALGIPGPAIRVRLIATEPGAVALDLGGDLLARLPKLPVGRLGDEPGRLTLREPTATVEALDRLAPALGPGRTIFGQASPLGRVRLDESACTSCGACVLVCPTDALALDRNAQGSVLSLDPGRCIPDGYCAAVCPEQALEVDLAVDVAAVRNGRYVLKEERLLCRRCGAPCSEQMMVNRIKSLLPPGLGAFLDDASELCAECAAGLMAEYTVAAEQSRVARPTGINVNRPGVDRLGAVRDP